MKLSEVYELIESSQKYQIIKELGSGVSSKVVLGRHIETNEYYAIKIYRHINDRTMTLFSREYENIKTLNHPNIIKMIEYFYLEQKNVLCLVMEYCEGGEFFDYLVQEDRELSEQEAFDFFIQIICAMNYAHSKGIIHRDLKPENMLLDRNKNIKIIDWGLSKKIPYFQDHTLKLQHTMCGSLEYVAPEVLKNEFYSGPESDIFSMGVLLYIMVQNGLPWTGRTPAEKMANLTRGKFIFYKRLTQQCEDLIKRMLNPNPDLRIRISQILEHPWVKFYKFGQDISNILCQPDYEVPQKEILDRMRKDGYNVEELLERKDTETINLYLKYLSDYL